MQALLEAAEYVASHQTECFQAFAVEPGITQVKPSCTSNGDDPVAYDEMAVGVTWTFESPGIVPDVNIEVVAATHRGLYPWITAGIFPGERCQSSHDNNHVDLIALEPEAPVFTLQSGLAWLRTDTRAAVAYLESSQRAYKGHCSKLSVSKGATPATVGINWMLLLGQNAQVVEGVQIDAFRAELQGPIVAHAIGGSRVEQLPLPALIRYRIATEPHCLHFRASLPGCIPQYSRRMLNRLSCIARTMIEWWALSSSRTPSPLNQGRARSTAFGSVNRLGRDKAR